MTIAEFIIFTASVGLLLFMPGPTNALMMTSGALSGIRTSLPLIWFEIAGYSLAIAPLLVLNEIAGTFQHELALVLKSLAALVTIAAAIRLWLRSAPDASDKARPTPMGIFLQTLFNPKALIFAFALIPPVAGPANLAAKAVTLVTLVALAASFWILVGATTRRVPALGRHLVTRTSSLVLAGFAAYFLSSVIGAIQL